MTRNSADLKELALKFDRLKVKIRQLIDALRAHHSSLVSYNSSRLLVAKSITSIAEHSTIDRFIGNVNNEKSSSEDLKSYIGIHLHMSKRHTMFSDRFLKYVVEYAVEWEKVIVGRVSNALKRAAAKRKNLDHYISKIERLEKKLKNKKSDDLIEKLKEYQQRLLFSRDEYDIYIDDLCNLLEEVTMKTWMDLHPIVMNLIHFEGIVAEDEEKCLKNFKRIADALEKVSALYGLKSENRLRELEIMCTQLLERKSANGEKEDDRHDEHGETASISNSTGTPKTEKVKHVKCTRI